MVPLLHTADEVADYLLEEGVAVVPGTGFGMNTHIRISYAVALSENRAGDSSGSPRPCMPWLKALRWSLGITDKPPPAGSPLAHPLLSL
jgi:hypothetical protein